MLIYNLIIALLYWHANQQKSFCLCWYFQHRLYHINQFRKIRVLKVATVSESVQFGFQPVSHFLLFLPGKERIISGTKLYNVSAVGFDLLPLPGAAEVPYGENTYNLSVPMGNFHSRHLKISSEDHSRDTKNQNLSGFQICRA